MQRVLVVVLIVAVLIAMTLWPDNSGLAPTPPEPGGAGAAGVEVESRLRGITDVRFLG